MKLLYSKKMIFVGLCIHVFTLRQVMRQSMMTLTQTLPHKFTSLAVRVMATQYWMIALPQKGVGTGLDSLRTYLGTNGMGKVLPFDTPSMAIGTLDSLMALTDDLVKINVQVEAILKKLERQYLDVVDSGADALRVNERSVAAYIDNFQWDSSRYKFTGVSMVEIVAQIQSMVAGVDDELKKMTSIYAEKNQNLSAAQRKKQINLATSDFEDFLEPQQVTEIGAIESEFLMTLMCVVPSALQQEFQKSYFTIGSDIAVYGNPDWSINSSAVGENNGQYGPRFSSTRSGERGSPVFPATPRKICEAGDMMMYAITALKGHYEAGVIVNGEITQGKFVDYLEPLTAAFRDKRFVIRPLKYDASRAGGVNSGIQSAESQVGQMKSSIIRWCKSHFGEVYSGWLHLKVIRQYAESILRYGVPTDSAPKYLTTFVQINEKLDKQANDALARFVREHYPELAEVEHEAEVDEGDDGDVDYLPYVFHKFAAIGCKK